MKTRHKIQIKCSICRENPTGQSSREKNKKPCMCETPPGFLFNFLVTLKRNSQPLYKITGQCFACIHLNCNCRLHKIINQTGWTGGWRGKNKQTNKKTHHRRCSIPVNLRRGAAPLPPPCQNDNVALLQDLAAKCNYCLLCFPVTPPHLRNFNFAAPAPAEWLRGPVWLTGK